MNDTYFFWVFLSWFTVSTLICPNSWTKDTFSLFCTCFSFPANFRPIVFTNVQVFIIYPPPQKFHVWIGEKIWVIHKQIQHFFPLCFACEKKKKKKKSWKKKTWKLSSWKNLLPWKKILLEKRKSCEKKKISLHKKTPILLKKFNLKKKKNILRKKMLHTQSFSPVWTLFYSLGTQIRWFTVYAAKNKVISNNHNKEL